MKRALAALAACLLLSAPAMAAKDKAPDAPKPRGKKVIATQDAPAAIGPYSQAIQAGPLLFVSGSLGMEPASGKLAAGGVAAETERSLDNLNAILKAAGASFDDVVKTTIFLTDMADFATVNEIYAKRFASAPPARSTVAVKDLPRGGKVEIEVIAIVPRKK
jgi:2-iminobutanoate/2-iminopropanoate deaminase